MKTIAPHAPTSHTSARCKASTPGAAVIDGEGAPGCRRIRHYTLTQLKKTTTLLSASLRAQRSNPCFRGVAADGLLRFARNDGEVCSTQYAFSLLVISASGVLSRM